MNSIEERDNLILLLQETLKFYANPENYRGTKTTGSCCGTPFSYIDMDEGSQARFALKRVEELNIMNQNLQEEYDKITMGLIDVVENNIDEIDPVDLIKVLKNLNND